MAKQNLGLTIFLIREDQVGAFEKQFPPAKGAAIASDSIDGWFIAFPSETRTPPWVTAVTSLLATTVEAGTLGSQSPAGLLAVRQSERLFVVTFGHAWQMLENDWLERDFGRRVALNALGKDQFIEIRTEQVFGKWHLTADRAPLATAVDQFGVRFDRDLVAVVEGATDKKYMELLGKTIRGGTSLRVSTDLSLLAELLGK